MIEKQAGKICDSILNEIAAFSCTLEGKDKNTSEYSPGVRPAAG